MYIRLNSTRFPSSVLITENEYKVANDKSCVLIKGIVEDGKFIVPPIATHRHAIHVYRNPALGPGAFQIITPDDGPTKLNTRLSKEKLAQVQELDYHFKVFFVRVDVPFMD